MEASPNISRVKKVFPNFQSGFQEPAVLGHLKSGGFQTWSHIGIAWRNYKDTDAGDLAQI